MAAAAQPCVRRTIYGGTLSFWDKMKDGFEKDFRFGKSKYERVAVFSFMGAVSAFMLWTAANTWGQWKAVAYGAGGALFAITFILAACSYSRGARFLIKLSFYAALIFLFMHLPGALKEWLLYALLLIGFFWFKLAVEDLYEKISELKNKNGA